MGERLCLGCMEQYNDKYDVCPYCGYAEGTPPKEAYHLIPGTVINQKYIVGKVIGYGGFGVTYMGYDAVLNHKVAIKEYLPGEFATRNAGSTDVTIFSGERREQFEGGIVKFIDEARRLAKFKETPGIVKIYDSFQANQTAYIVMEYLEGETLKEKIERDGKLSLNASLKIMMPIINALKEVHKEGILHRDISPDNIFLTKQGDVKLLDFGAARYATTSHSKSLSVIVKPGYAPQEQYRSRGDQGTWTDVYACAATLYKMITGVTPEDSMERATKDTLVPPSKLGIKIPKNKENAIMNAMNLRIEDRTKTADEFARNLSTENDVKRNKVRIKKMDVGRWPLWLKITSGVAATAIVAFIVMLLTGVIKFSGVFHKDSGELKAGYVYAPSVINFDLKEAEGIVSEKNLITQIVDKQNSDEIPRDLVMLQSIPSGKVVKEKTVLELTVSAGKETEYMIDVRGMSKEEAQAALKALGFNVEFLEEKSEVAPGYVTRQEEDEGSELEKGSTVTIYISIGNDNYDENKKTKVPDVVGKSWEEAQKTMADAKLYIYRAGTEYSDTVPQGYIISQNVKKGKKVAEGTKIDVIVSAGARKSRVPDVQFKSESDATTMLSDAGLTVDVQYEDSSTVKKNHVIRQSVEAGTTVSYGSAITIWISLGNPEATVEYVEDTTEKPHATTEKPHATTEKPQATTEKPQATTEKPQATTEKPDADKKVLVNKITLSEVGITLNVGNSIALTATVSPSNASNKALTWSSSSSSVATVDSNGRVTAKAAGQAVITATAKDGSNVSATCRIIVNEPDPEKVLVTGITLSASKNSLNIGDSVKVVATVSPSNADNKNITWSSSDTNVATVDSGGTVTARAAGNVEIKATAKDGSGKTGTYNITVIDPDAGKVTSITLSATKDNLNIGDTVKITATVLPSNADNKNLTWSSSDTSIATVDSSGTVTAKAAGTVDIKATAQDGSGKSATYKISVIDPDAGKVSVPNLVGKTETAAKTALENAGLVLGTVTYKHDTSGTTGKVLTQATSAGTKVYEGSSVSISVCDNTKEYRYAVITTETKESTNSTMSGWTQTGSYYNFNNSSWSSWSTTKVTASDSRQVNERKVNKYNMSGYTAPGNNDYWYWGETGEQVKWIQAFLVQKYGSSVLGSYGIDGEFGASTQSAVKRYQGDKGLTQDGSVGPNTIAAMKNDVNNEKITQYQYRDGIKTYTYERKVQGEWSSWSTTVPTGSNITTEERYKY